MRAVLQTSDPASRFLSLLRAALLGGGRAHVAERHGGVPESPEQWDWRKQGRRREWVAQGTRIGWLAGTDVYLEPHFSYQVAQQMAGNEPLAVSKQTLRRRLHERQLLASIDVGRHTLLVRRTLEGHPRQVLHLRAGSLMI